MYIMKDIVHRGLCIKGFVYRLSHDCHFDVDGDVSTADSRSSSGDSVDLLSGIIIWTTFVVSDWGITNLAHGWWISIQMIMPKMPRNEIHQPWARFVILDKPVSSLNITVKINLQIYLQ